MCTYLDQVGSTYYFRRVVPAELRPYLLTATGKPRAEFKLSLGTKDRETAKRLLPDFVQRTDRLFDEARSKLPAEGPAQENQSEPIDGGWLGEFANEQAEFAARQDAERQRRRAERRHYRDQWREQLDYSTARMPPRYAALKDLMREQEERAASAEARLAAMQVSASTTSPTDANAAASRPEASLLLHKEIVDGWAAERGPQRKGIEAHRSVARWFYERVGEKAVGEITRQDVLSFKSKLLEEGQTPANIKQKLSRLRTLLQWAADNGHAPANVAHGITIKDTQAAKNKRKPFDLPSLNAIFASPVYARGDRPPQGRGEAAYWLPLLALFTGARMEELGQLRPSDVVRLTYPDPNDEEQASWFLHLVEVEGEDGPKLKNAASERLVPIHAELERLGFLAFAQAMRDQEQERLFPLLTRGPFGNFTHKWGQWFGSYLRNVCLVTDRRMVFHSFRHTFTDYVRRPDIPEGIQRQLVGHSSKDVHDDYGAGYNLHWLVEAMKLYKVPGLKMPPPPPSGLEA
jgi:integrase